VDKKYHVWMKKHIQMELINDFFHRLERLSKMIPKFLSKNFSIKITSVKYSRTIRLPSREHDLSQITEDFLSKINRK
jgi:hypothetical protein